MEIDIEDYVSADEIKQTILYAVKDRIRNLGENDIKRIYTNACYEAVTQRTDEAIKERGIEFSIQEQVKKIINELSTFNVFYKDPFGEGSSYAYKLTQKIVEEEKEMLREVIKSRIQEAYTTSAADVDVARLMSDTVYDIFSISKKQEG